MPSCYKCGGEIKFYHNGFNAIPVHVTGSCWASGGSTVYGGGSHWVERETEYGQRFVFRWVEYPSYVNPNARCPVCGEDVYFYQSPYGGRVFFDELGPPWPKHPCTSSDDFFIQRKVREFDPEELFPKPEKLEETIQKTGDFRSRVESLADSITPRQKASEWRRAGWSPLLLSKADSTSSGLVICGSELLEDSKTIEHKLSQINIEDLFQEANDNLVFSYSIAMNSNRLISALRENVVFIRRVLDGHFEISTISISKDDRLVHFSLRMKEQKN